MRTTRCYFLAHHVTRKIHKSEKDIAKYEHSAHYHKRPEIFITNNQPIGDSQLNRTKIYIFESLASKKLSESNTYES